MDDKKRSEEPERPRVLTLAEGALDSFETYVAFADRAVELTREALARRRAAADERRSEE